MTNSNSLSSGQIEQFRNDNRLLVTTLDTMHSIGKPTRVERILVVFIMYLASTARIPFLSSASQADTGLYLDIIRLTGYALSVALILAFHQSWLRGLLGVKAIALLMVLSVASVTWSISPNLTFGQAVVLGGMTALGVYIGSRYAPDQVMRMVVITTTIIAVVSILVVTLLPSFGGTYFGMWRGVFVHKNLLGQTMACGALGWALIGLAEAGQRLLAIVMFSVCSTLVVLSNSITSAVVLVLVLAALPLIRFASEGSMRAFGVLAATGIVVPIVITNFDRTMEPLLLEAGRDPSLTGRTRIWASAIDAIRERPLLGYGHSAYWLDADVARRMEQELYWSPPYAHNGYLDLFLSVGVVGFLLFMLSLIASGRNALTYARMSDGNSGSSFPAAFLLFFVLYNSAESITGVQTGYVWILYVAVSVSLAMTVQDGHRSCGAEEHTIDETGTSMTSNRSTCNRSHLTSAS